jgi:phthalate 4,5-dioxygenase oxygenase subunit
LLTAHENAALTQTAPGTPAGELLRRYWQPVALVDEIDNVRPAKAVRIMSEDLVLFRNERGEWGLIERQCAHRGADLAFGRLEAGGIRCLYHGWLYGPDGRCWEQPAEPEGSRFYEKIRVASYPCQVVNGVVLAYLGPGNPPPLPRFDALRAPAPYTFAFKGLWECNWLQGVEGGIDPSHVSFLHRFLGEDPRENYGQQFREPLEGTDRPRSAVVREDPRPQITVEPTDYGLRLFALRRLEGGRRHVRLTNLLFPNAFVVPFGNHQAFVQWHVPIDDFHHFWYMILYDFRSPLDQTRLRAQREASYRLPDYRPVRNRSNQWGFDPVEQQTLTYTGMGLDINVHDQWAVESAGPIYDRTREHLGAQDVAIIAYRRLLFAAMGRGSPNPRPLSQDVPGPVALDFLAEEEDWQQEWPRRDALARQASPWAAHPAEENFGHDDANQGSRRGD